MSVHQESKMLASFREGRYSVRTSEISQSYLYRTQKELLRTGVTNTMKFSSPEAQLFSLVVTSEWLKSVVTLNKDLFLEIQSSPLRPLLRRTAGKVLADASDYPAAVQIVQGDIRNLQESGALSSSVFTTIAAAGLTFFETQRAFMEKPEDPFTVFPDHQKTHTWINTWKGRLKEARAQAEFKFRIG